MMTRDRPMAPTTSTTGSAVGVRVTGLTHQFGSFCALADVSLDVRRGEFMTLLGPSGSGKTTLLRLVGGLLSVQAGRIELGEREITRLPPRKRDIGFVFQNYAVFPHLTVFENVAFPLRLRHMAKAEVQRRVADALERVSLGDLGGRLPAQLSGGQQQRVALARAVVYEPSVLLMDEPLGALDKRLRRGLQVEIRRLQQELGITTLYVTHDQEEAFAMSDRIAVMNNGEILQTAPPDTIYYSPASSFVADFVGDMNRLDGVMAPVGGKVARLRTSDDLSIAVAVDDAPAPGAAAICGVRPEQLKLGAEVRADNVVPCSVRAVRFNGSHVVVHLNLPGDREFLAEVRDPGGRDLRVGDQVQAGWDIDDGMVFIEEPEPRALATEEEEDAPANV